MPKPRQHSINSGKTSFNKLLRDKDPCYLMNSNFDQKKKKIGVLVSIIYLARSHPILIDVPQCLGTSLRSFAYHKTIPTVNLFWKYLKRHHWPSFWFTEPLGLIEIGTQ
ncbi:hypothetical protein TNIN_247411 [Trichonephila inaurata madagascariensis]|uniref:Uncharacterized protein n=1 Tax=Trichonephila inaurata madagascariensis TaxID=2747483 RepID=A0A8X6X1C2_9ARAC|nr:hypothetical protein TNIN_247411 [Trichonephila inaurata madagascariensis]